MNKSMDDFIFIDPAAAPQSPQQYIPLATHTSSTFKKQSSHFANGSFQQYGGGGSTTIGAATTTSSQARIATTTITDASHPFQSAPSMTEQLPFGGGGSTSTKAFNTRTQQFSRKKLFEEAIQIKQRAMFLKAQVVSTKQTKDNILLQPKQSVSASIAEWKPPPLQPVRKRISTAVTLTTAGQAKKSGRIPIQSEYNPPGLSDVAQARLDGIRRQKKESDFNQIIKSSVDKELKCIH